MAQLGVSAPDPQTVRFELERPTPYFPRILTSNATVPVPRHAIEANGRNWTKAGTMVSNGAFTLTEWVHHKIGRDVVEGKRVAERLDLGGRRLTKKKKRTKRVFKTKHA